MALRLQDTEEDNSHFVRGLKGPYKAFWYWLKRNCNHAGVWVIDMEFAIMRVGFDLDQDEAEKVFSGKVLKLNCGEKWFLVNFCDEQYKTNVLNPANTAHRGAIRILERVGLIDLNFNVLKEQTKPLTCSFKAAKDLDRDLEPLPLIVKEVVISEVKTKSVPKNETEKTYLTPLVQAFRDFKEMRAKNGSKLTERAASMIHAKLQELAGDDEQLKIDILNQSTMRGWTGVFELKSDLKQSEKPAAPTATRTPRKTA